MPDQDIFDDKDKTNDSGDPTNSQDNLWADQLNTITNENGEPKYKTVEDALKALQHSQNHIQTLEQEKKDMATKMTEVQSELEKRASVESAVEKLLQKPKDEEPNADPQKVDSLDESKVLELVQQTLAQQAQTQTVANNVDKVARTLTEKFGDKSAETIRQRAKELGTTPQALKELSGTNPELVLGLFAGGVPNNDSPMTPGTNLHQRKEKPEAPKPEKNLITGGASDAEMKEYMQKIREYTYKQMGVVE